jgi:hypothetical protein
MKVSFCFLILIIASIAINYYVEIIAFMNLNDKVIIINDEGKMITAIIRIAESKELKNPNKKYTIIINIKY